MANEPSQDDRNAIAGRPAKDHWYPWFPRDFFADEHVLTMDMECEGAYRRLLDHQWLHGSIPTDMVALAAICRGVTTAKMRKMWGRLSPCFPIDCGDGRRQNRKLERIRAEREAFHQKRRDAGQKGNAKRWKKGRNAIAEGSQSDRTATILRVANTSPPQPLPQVSGCGVPPEISEGAETPPPDGGAIRPEPMPKPARVREGFLGAAGRSGKSAFLDEVDALRREAGAE